MSDTWARVEVYGMRLGWLFSFSILHLHFPVCRTWKGATCWGNGSGWNRDHDPNEGSISHFEINWFSGVSIGKIHPPRSTAAAVHMSYVPKLAKRGHRRSRRAVRARCAVSGKSSALTPPNSTEIRVRARSRKPPRSARSRTFAAPIEMHTVHAHRTAPFPRSHVYTAFLFTVADRRPTLLMLHITVTCSSILR